MAISMKCPHCGQTIPADSVYCTYCGQRVSNPMSNYTMNQSQPDHRTKVILSIVGVLLALGIGVTSGVWAIKQEANTQTVNPIQQIFSEVESSQTENIVSSSTTESNVLSVNEAKNTDMSVGEIGNVGNVSVGLSYVKRMNALPTSLGNVDDNLAPGTEVILGFFDFHNKADAPARVKPGDITCYADGIQVKPVENYINVECDGVKQFDSVSIEDNTGLCSVQDFAVPSGWNELKFFYGSNCSWIVHQDEASVENFVRHSMYDDVGMNFEVTQPGMGIATNDHQIVFDGAGLYSDSNMFLGESYYVVFKFRVDNISSTDLDYDLVGYNMSAYCNGYMLDDTPEIFISDSIDGYSNIFDVDTIAPGMSANIYVAFECEGDNGTYSLVYDEGYIVSKRLGVVTVDLQYDTGMGNTADPSI